MGSLPAPRQNDRVAWPRALCVGRSVVGPDGRQLGPLASWAEQGGMDLSVSLVAREASQGQGPSPGFGLNGLPRPAPPKVAKKPKKGVLFFEVEILDAKTREKLCFLDKVGPRCRLPMTSFWGLLTPREMGVLLQTAWGVRMRGPVFGPGPVPASSG